MAFNIPNANALTKQVWKSWAVIIIIIIIIRDRFNLLCPFLIISYYYHTMISISFSEFWVVICFNKFRIFCKQKKKKKKKN